ncbi:stAR-related lipid transfer protein 9 isoform X2 [Varanus komodoensis]|uniref:stAR-related lipid transfer protein 9 isoform X2 n=1 Tax=Varanus komodoensis TaxID=61221 RepID=UPI001CF7D923|nr:stAR-related lipid transfer protein 9 isoform X2 [Varanus komodoensis]
MWQAHIKQNVCDICLTYVAQEATYREQAEGGRIIIEVEDRVAKVRNIKVDNRYEGPWEPREKVVAFGFDYCYWSVDPEDSKYSSQEVVFQDLGTSVLSGAFKGYNICLFAYGQTGSGKTYTMMGTPASIGLTPRICEGLFSREDDCSKQSASCRVEVSFLEIYNERVRDLLRQSDHKKPYTLRVREHPEMGPYVQGLSQHVVTDYKQVVGLLEEGIANRITAATHVHDASSRSHAIFTIQYTQAILENNLPSEIASKINLVDLAGSERADPSYCKDRITEGANINKSLVTLGIVISTLAQNSQMFNSCQSINSIASEGDSNHTDNHCGASISSQKRQAYIPYRDSILTWLLKDSLGGNSKTIMIATVSPASSCYNETMSTLRYASNAQNIINKPRVNEDANVKLIRELREEIDRLKAMLMSFELRNSSPSWSDEKEGNLTELVLQNEIKIDRLTKDWTDKWINRKAIMEEYSVDINRKKAGVMIDSSLPHLMAVDDDILSTGVVLYHLREGITKIGRSDSNQEQDIVLQGQWIERDHCVVDNQHGIVTLQPLQGAHCVVNGQEVTDSVRLSQGALIILGKAHKFRFNHPAEAAILRQRRSISESSSVMISRSLEWLDLDGDFPSLSYSFYPAETERFFSNEQRDALHEECQTKLKNQEVLQSREIQQQQLYVEELQQQILDGQIKAEQELEHDQAVINEQIKENQQWLIDEKKRLAVQQQQQESAVQTDVKSYAEAGIQNVLELEIGPSLTEQNKKKLVQLELLRKFSLKKAERHLSRKKVKLHLERIVKKQKLLEAKKNLKWLEATCWITEDTVKHSQSQNKDAVVTSWDCKYSQLKSDSHPLQCRKNLSHQSFFLEKDPCQLSTSAHSYGCSKVNPPRQSLSIEYLPRTIHEFVRRDNIHDEKDVYFPTQSHLIKNQKSLYLGNKRIVGNNSSDTDVISHTCKDSQKMEKLDNKPWQTRSKAQSSKNCSPDHFKKKCAPETAKRVVKAKPLGDSNQSTGKHLEKNDAQAANRKVRTDKRKKCQSSVPGYPSKELKKSGVSDKPAVQQLNKSAKNGKRDSKGKPSVEQHELLRITTSARSLNNLNTHTLLCHGEKRWHSAETLNFGISKAAPDPLGSWQEAEDIEFSDTDSSYSVDSLSCANANVLTEQLNHEESAETDMVDLECSESDDSQMSQDSLTEKENKTKCKEIKLFSEVHQKSATYCKDHKYQPISLIANSSGNNLTLNERSFSLDSLGDVDEVSGEDLAGESKLGSFDEVPVEVFWKLQNLKSESIKNNWQHNPDICNEAVRQSDDLNLNTSSFYLDANIESSSSNSHNQAVKELELRFSGQECSLDQRSHIAGENLPILTDSWLSYDVKNGKSSPIIAMPSSQDHTEFQVAQLHPVNKSNCWLKKDDLRQSAAELSFVSCYRTPHRISHEPNNIEMLLSSAAPSVPLPETRKYCESETSGATSLYPLSTFPPKHSYCEVASPPNTNCPQAVNISEDVSSDEWRQTTTPLKEASPSQVSEKQGLSTSSIYPEISKDQTFKNSALSSVPSTHTLQKTETYLNTNFEESLFRNTEKENTDYDSDGSTSNPEVDKSICTLPSESPDSVTIHSTEEKYQGHEHLFSKEGTISFRDESSFGCGILSKCTNSFTNIREEEYSADGVYYDKSNFDLVEKTRYQQVSAEENKLSQDKTMTVHHTDQLALSEQTPEIEGVSMQESRAILIESALEVPSEVEEGEGQYGEWSSENNFKFKTEALMKGFHSGLNLDYSGNTLSRNTLTCDADSMVGKNSEGGNYNIVSFSRHETPSASCMDFITDKSMYSNLDLNEKKTELPVDCSCSIGDQLTQQSNSTVCDQNAPRMEKYSGKCQNSVVIEDVCKTKSSCMENDLNNSGSVHTTDQKHNLPKDLNNSAIFDSTVHSDKTKSQHMPASREQKEAPSLQMFFNGNDCSVKELHSDQDRRESGKELGNSGIGLATTSQEPSLYVKKASDYLKERVVTGPLTSSEDNKNDCNNKTINSEEPVKLINSVDKLESDILEIKYSQKVNFQNYLRVETQNETSESKTDSENYSLLQKPSNDHEKCYKKLSTAVIQKQIDKEKTPLIDVKIKGLCASKPIMGADSNNQAFTVNHNKTHENVKENDCPTDIEARSESIGQDEYPSPTTSMQFTVDSVDTCEEPGQVDRTIENVFNSVSTVNAVTAGCRQEDLLDYSGKDDKNSASTEILMNPKLVQENKAVGDILCSPRMGNEQSDVAENEVLLNCRLTGLCNDENVILLQENVTHGLMNCDSNSNSTDLDDAEIPEVYFTASKLGYQEDVPLLPETCFDTSQTHEEKSLTTLWSDMDIINETLEDNNNDGNLCEGRAVTGQCGINKFKQLDNVENISSTKYPSLNYSHKSSSEHCNANFVGSRLDVYKCMPVHCILKEKETVCLSTSVQLDRTDLIAQHINTESMNPFKTENEKENLEENNKSLELDGLQNEADILPENAHSYWYSNSDTSLNEVSKEKEWLPHIFSRISAAIVDDSISDRQTEPPESTNQDCELNSMAVKSFPLQNISSPLSAGINTNGENMKGDPATACNSVVSLNRSTENEVFLQYYETQMDSDMQVGIVCTINKGEVNDSLSGVMKNKYIIFPPDQLQKDGEMKKDLICNKMSNYTTSKQSLSTENICSNSDFAECHESLAFSLADDMQNRGIPLKSCDIGSPHGEYSTKENKEQYLNSLNIPQKECAASALLALGTKNTLPSPTVKENMDKITPLLPALSSQESLNSIISPKELNSLMQHDQANKCLGSNCIKAEYKTNNEKFTEELECQIETTDILLCRASHDPFVEHSDDIVPTCEDGVNFSEHSNQAFWENIRYDEDRSAGYSNSCISEYSSSHLNRTTMLPNVLLECPRGKHKAGVLCFGESKYLDSEVCGVPLSFACDYAQHQQDDKISDHADSTKNTQEVVEIYQNGREVQDYIPECQCNQGNNANNVPLHSDNCVDLTEIRMKPRSSFTHQSLKQISSDEVIPAPLCSVENISTSIVFKNAGTLEPSRSPESSICRPYTDSLQDAFLSPCLSTSFQVQESPSFCHQAFPDRSFGDIPCSSSTSVSFNMSEMERHTELYVAVSGCSTLATSQIQESQCDKYSEIFDQLNALEITSFSKENRCLSLSDTKANSQKSTSLECHGMHKFESDEFYNKAEVCQELRDNTTLQTGCLEDTGKTLHHTLNSSLDSQGDAIAPHLNKEVNTVSITNKNTDNPIISCKVMKNEKDLISEQPNLSVINDSVSSQYFARNNCLTLQEEPAPEIPLKENKVLTSRNANKDKEDGQRPALQNHSLSAPAIGALSNFACASDTSRTDFPVHLASKSLQELNMSVEPPSPTEDDLHRTENLSKRDNVVPIKYKPRFQKKSSPVQKFSHCDKINRREQAQGSHSLDPSPVRYPVAIGHVNDNPVNAEIGTCSDYVTSVCRYNTGKTEELGYQVETADGLVQDNEDAMHFCSSDTNPYIHPWQQVDHCKIGWKQYVFGSASDVSSNPPPLNLDNQTVMRCSSVDNGLNSNNSPFHSHLSSYANARMLSSTISSTEDLQGWDVARAGFESTRSDESGKHHTSVSQDELETPAEKCVSGCEDILPNVRCSQQSGNTSMQVDEIVLLYPSESDLTPNTPQRVFTCEQETQTETPARHKRQKRHRRSYTDTPARKPEPDNLVQQPSSWSSVQNLSVHLSQLLQNTSELLGNLSLSTVKDNEQSDHKAIEEHIRTTMSDSCTQTTKDIGIQTDILGHPQSEIKESNFSTNMESESMKSQEVNVIVKLVHSDTVALTKERESESKEQICQSVLSRSYDAHAQGDSYVPQPANSSLEVPEIPLNVLPGLASGTPKVSVTTSAFGSGHKSSTTVVNSPALSQVKDPVETRGLCCKNSLLVDRASSPILTLSASPASQKSASDKSTCSFKGSSGQQKDNANSATSFIKGGSGLQYELGSWDPRVETSSQTEVDSESTTSRESKEMCTMSGNGLDKNSTKETSRIGALKQKHKFTIDTHTAVHTKRLYHSSSTLELSSHGEYLVDDHREPAPVEHSFHQIRATRRARNLSGGIKYESPIRNSEGSPAKKSSQKSLNEYHSTAFLRSDETPQCVLDSFSPQCHQTWRNQKCYPFPMSEMSDMQDIDDTETGSDTESECNTEILLNENASLVKTHRVRSYSLRDLPLHNKFSNWCGVKGGPHSSFTSLTQSASDIHNQVERKMVGTRTAEIEERSLLSERRAREIESLQKERAQVMSGIHLDMNQHPLTIEMTEAKLTYGIGETDAQLRILQGGVSEDLTLVPIKQHLYERHRKSIEMLRKQREERLQGFRRSRSLSPQKHLSLFQTMDTNQKDLDLPSRRREYLQQLRRDVVENTRVQDPKVRIHPPSEIELLLRDYHRAREETKTEIARARDKLRERAEQEKRRIREQIFSQLQKEETKLKTVVSTSSLCTESTLSLSSGPTSGYNSSNTATYPTSIPGKQKGQASSEDIEHSRDDTRGRSAVRNHQLYILDQLQKGSTGETFSMTCSSVGRSSIRSPLSCSHRNSPSQIVLPSTFLTSPVKGYEDLSKHVLANATAEVMAMSSNDLKNLYNGQATAGWKYQCMEKDIRVYYKAFSSSATKHGFLGAGVINRPLSTVLCLLKDPTKRHLYDKTITTAQVHKKISSEIELVYVVSDVSLCYQKQPRDFCCISVEAKEENICILAIQSVYEESMPRPCKEMVRGEILPSAWVLEPDTKNGKDITKVIYMVQVDLGAPAIPERLLSSIVKRQPLVIARLAQFLAA